MDQNLFSVAVVTSTVSMILTIIELLLYLLGESVELDRPTTTDFTNFNSITVPNTATTPYSLSKRGIISSDIGSHSLPEISTITSMGGHGGNPNTKPGGGGGGIANPIISSITSQSTTALCSSASSTFNNNDLLHPNPKPFPLTIRDTRNAPLTSIFSSSLPPLPKSPLSCHNHRQDSFMTPKNNENPEVEPKTASHQPSQNLSPPTPPRLSIKIDTSTATSSDNNNANTCISLDPLSPANLLNSSAVFDRPKHRKMRSRKPFQWMILASSNMAIHGSTIANLLISTSRSACRASMIFYIGGVLFYIFYLLLNSLRSALYFYRRKCLSNNLPHPRKFEYQHYIWVLIALVPSAILSIVPALLGFYDYHNDLHMCWFDDSKPIYSSMMLVWIIYSCWVCLGVLCLVLTAAWVTWLLAHENRDIRNYATMAYQFPSPSLRPIISGNGEHEGTTSMDLTFRHSKQLLLTPVAVHLRNSTLSNLSPLRNGSIDNNNVNSIAKTLLQHEEIEILPATGSPNIGPRLSISKNGSITRYPKQQQQTPPPPSPLAGQTSPKSEGFGSLTIVRNNQYSK